MFGASSRVTNILLVVVTVALVANIAMMANVAMGGPIDPPGPVSSTMKTLNDIPPSWHQLLASNDGNVSGCNSSRFKCVMDGTAVLDLETGLIWQRTPPTGTENWYAADADCTNVVLGARYGWRLPRIEEFRSLLDDSGLLPSGHPFQNVSTDIYGYWSASLSPVDPRFAQWAMFGVSPPAAESADGHRLYVAGHVWCVRGGIGIVDAY